MLCALVRMWHLSKQNRPLERQDALRPRGARSTDGGRE